MFPCVVNLLREQIFSGIFRHFISNIYYYCHIFLFK